MAEDVTGDFARTPLESVLDPMLAEVQAEGLVVPQAEGVSLLEAFQSATADEDES